MGTMLNGSIAFAAGVVAVSMAVSVAAQATPELKSKMHEKFPDLFKRL